MGRSDGNVVATMASARCAADRLAAMNIAVTPTIAVAPVHAAVRADARLPTKSSSAVTTSTPMNQVGRTEYVRNVAAIATASSIPSTMRAAYVRSRKNIGAPAIQ